MSPAPRQAKPRLLDIGCGTGLFLALARDSGFDVEGIEISERLSKLAQSHYGVPVTCGEFSSITLREAVYDVITMWDLLEHVVDPVAVIRRCRALLRPGGRVVIFTIDSSSLFNAIGDLGYRLSGKSWARPLELLYDARHNYYFTPETLDTVLARGGLHATARTSHRAFWTLAERAGLAAHPPGWKHHRCDFGRCGSAVPAAGLLPSDVSHACDGYAFASGA